MVVYLFAVVMFAGTVLVVLSFQSVARPGLGEVGKVAGRAMMACLGGVWFLAAVAALPRGRRHVRARTVRRNGTSGLLVGRPVAYSATRLLALGMAGLIEADVPWYTRAGIVLAVAVIVPMPWYPWGLGSGLWIGPDGIVMGSRLLHQSIPWSAFQTSEPFDHFTGARGPSLHAVRVLQSNSVSPLRSGYVVLDFLTAPPQLSLAAITYYWQHPENRSELAGQAAVDRFVTGDFPSDSTYPFRDASSVTRSVQLRFGPPSAER